MHIPPHTNTTAAAATSENRADDRLLRRAAQEFEAAFLAEMLKTAGLGKTRGPFSGGAGEDQFASFLVRAQAGEMARAGGIGLAETIYRSLKERQDG